jgi:aromatase
MSTPTTTAGAALRIDTSGCFAHSSVQFEYIAAPAEAVVARLYAVADWPTFLPHVLDIDVRYDDGQYQEFIMVVASETGGEPLRVRSIRNCRAREIEFFQPEPPVFLRNHGGRWTFLESGTGCLVEVTHVWNLKDDVATAQFPATPDASTEQQVASLLAGHSRLTLGAWKRVLEEV